MQKAIIYILSILTIFSCTAPSGGSAGEGVVGDTLALRHSSLLQIIDYSGYTVVNIKNPWKEGRMLHSYMLRHKDSADVVAPEGMTLLRTPLDNQLVFATLHAQLFVTLGCVDAVSGVCDARYMSVAEIKEGLQTGKITDCGESVDVNLERVVQLSPDAAWVVPFKNSGYGKLERVGVPLVECADYMESSPLGCAEWMRFYGRLLGVEERADSLFAAVCENYGKAKRRAASFSHKPRLLCEQMTGSAWYVPAGGSTMGRLYEDAGASYLFADIEGSGAVPLSFEAVLSRAESADIWLIKYGAESDMDYSSLVRNFAGNRMLRPFRERRVFACNVARKRFYEETPFRPDILLQELVALLHPDSVGGYELRYYEKLQD